jgi:hypothetical protein
MGRLRDWTLKVIIIALVLRHLMASLRRRA